MMERQSRWWQRFIRHKQSDQEQKGSYPIITNSNSEEWPNVVRQIREHHESLRQVAADYGVSRETIRRLLRTTGKRSAG
jgi:Sigma-70, region 4